MRANSSSLPQYRLPGRELTPPMSMIAAPCSIIFSILLVASFKLAARLAGLKLSELMFTTPIISQFCGLANFSLRNFASSFSPKSCSASFCAKASIWRSFAIKTASVPSRPRITPSLHASSAPILRASCFKIFAAGARRSFR